jgi:hypothetical protein
MLNPKIICWDLDETLGFFREIISIRDKQTFPDPDDTYILRKDILKVLNRLMDKGYHHVVTSSAKRRYTEGVLQAVCLDAYFDGVFGRKDVTDGMWGKKYLPVAEASGINDSQARAGMLVIANLGSDEPMDIDIVFIHDERPIETSAYAYEIIADSLWAAGKNSFRLGFEKFFNSGMKISCLDKDFDFMLVSTNIAPGLVVNMGYKNSPCTEGLKIPTIMNIRAG